MTALLTAWTLHGLIRDAAAQAPETGSNPTRARTPPSEGGPDVHEVTISGGLTFRIPKAYLSPPPPAPSGNGPFNWGWFEFAYKMPGPMPLAPEENGYNVFRRQREIRAEDQYQPIKITGLQAYDPKTAVSERKKAEYWKTNYPPDDLREDTVAGMDHFYIWGKNGYEMFLVIGHIKEDGGRDVEVNSLLRCPMSPHMFQLCDGAVVAQELPFSLHIQLRRDDAENFPADVSAALALARGWYQPRY